MVEIKKVKVNLELEVDIPKDVAEDDDRYTVVKDGIIKSISKGMYEQGIAFRIINSYFDSKFVNP